MLRLLTAGIFAAIATIATAAVATAAAPVPSAEAYRFELAGPVQSQDGTSIVPVRLIHLTDNKPVAGAIVIESRADMGPIGMGEMTAPIKTLPVTTPGIYPFEVQNGAVWKKAGEWSLSFGAKVQGEAGTVRGSITVELKP